MKKKQRTPAQLANDERLRNRSKQAPEETKDTVEDIAPDPGTDDILRQLRELQETNALLKAAILGNQAGNQQPEFPAINRKGLVGEVEKYLVDPANYPDPTPRLKSEPRLQSIAFNFNYELDYDVSISTYENKGIHYKEPKFLVQLNRIVLDDQGNPTNKRYIARRLIFHEDPQAAMVIARDNGIEIDESDEKRFLDEMRYLRVRDWLFSLFWPAPTKEEDKIKEEVIGGTIVQVFTKSSQDPSQVDFDKITRVL